MILKLKVSSNKPSSRWLNAGFISRMRRGLMETGLRVTLTQKPLKAHSLQNGVEGGFCPLGSWQAREVRPIQLLAE